MHTFAPLMRAFNSVKFSIPNMYPAHIEIGQVTVTTSEVYRTIHTDVMMLKCTFIVLNTTLCSALWVLITPLFSSVVDLLRRISDVFINFGGCIIVLRSLRQLSSISSMVYKSAGTVVSSSQPPLSISLQVYRCLQQW